LTSTNVVTGKANRQALIESLGDNGEAIAEVLGLVPEYNDKHHDGYEVSLEQQAQDDTLDAALAVSDDAFVDLRGHRITKHGQPSTWIDLAGYNCVRTKRWRPWDIKAYRKHVEYQQDTRKYWCIDSILFQRKAGHKGGYSRVLRQTPGQAKALPSKRDRIAAKLAALDAKRANRK
jgi:hypothetical protein